MKFTVSWRLSIFVPGLKDVEENGFRASKFCYLFIGVQLYAQKPGCVWKGCLRIEWFSSLSAFALFEKAKN